MVMNSWILTNHNVSQNQFKKKMQTETYKKNESKK